jgi:hypothetical protein
MYTINSNEFHVVLALSKTIMFNISYYTLRSNKNPYFSTSADFFNKPKTDFSRCGQCQDDATKAYPKARNFYKKWDNKHLQQLTNEEYQELIKDVEVLMLTYPYVIKQKENNSELHSFNFYTIKDFSMSVYRNNNKKAC